MSVANQINAECCHRSNSSHSWYLKYRDIANQLLVNTPCTKYEGHSICNAKYPITLSTDSVSFELPHVKTNKVSVRPVKTQISLGIRPVWSVFAVCMKKAWVLSYLLSTQRRLWSDLVDAQADLSLCWAHGHFVGIVMRQLILCYAEN